MNTVVTPLLGIHEYGTDYAQEWRKILEPARTEWRMTKHLVKKRQNYSIAPLACSFKCATRHAPPILPVASGREGKTKNKQRGLEGAQPQNADSRPGARGV